MDQDVLLMVDALKSGSYLLAGSLATMVGVRTFRLDTVQSRLPAKLRWDNWPLVAQWAFVFVTASCAATLKNVAGGTSWKAGALDALLYGVGAIFGHKKTQDIGQLYDMKTLKQDPAYVLSPVRKNLQVLFPVASDVLKPFPREVIIDADLDTADKT